MVTHGRKASGIKSAVKWRYLTSHFLSSVGTSDKACSVWDTASSDPCRRLASDWRQLFSSVGITVQFNLQNISWMILQTLPTWGCTWIISGETLELVRGLTEIAWRPFEQILACSSKTVGDKRKMFAGNMSGYARITLRCHRRSAVVNNKRPKIAHTPIFAKTRALRR